MTSVTADWILANSTATVASGGALATADVVTDSDAIAVVGLLGDAEETLSASF
jgi:hypothetical protein